MKKLTAILILFSCQMTFSQTRKAFEEDLDYYVELLHLPVYALGIAKGDSIIYFKSKGSVTPDGKDEITKDHIFEIASITKSFTSIALQQMEAEGKLSLNDPLDKFPNKYFTRERWSAQTTLANILSHTSESDPVGTNFVYNGSKFNTVFNAIAAVGYKDTTNELTRPFTWEIEKRILFPLKMTHTLTRYSEKENAELKKWVVTQYAFNKTNGQFTAVPVKLEGMESGPGYGMFSSVRDLVTYSAAWGKNTILSAERYNKITAPFYPGSPQGMGCFTINFEGNDLHWGYGYGSNSSALLLRVPSKNLTLIFLSPTGVHSAATDLGFGDPLNSPIAALFVRNYVMNKPESIAFDTETSKIERQLRELTKKSKSRIYIEEAFSIAMVMKYMSKSDTSYRQKEEGILKMIIKNYPGDVVLNSPSAFELMSSSDDKMILMSASKLAKKFKSEKGVHPAKLLYAGIVEEKLGNQASAIAHFKSLADGDSFKEQGYKFDAMMKLAKYYQASDKQVAKGYLERLIKYKDYVNSKDSMYNEATQMISKM